MNIKVLVFDLDGVIIDSVYECYITALKAFNRMGEVLEDTPGVWEESRKARVFVKIAEDYYLVLKAIKEKLLDFDKITQEEFNQKNKEFLGNKGAEFKELFYQIRGDMQKENLDAWIKLHKLYPGVKQILEQLSNKYKIVISTTKDKKSISAFRDCLGIKCHDALDKDMGKDKRIHIRTILEKYKVKPEEVLFIDDILEHILKVKETGVNIIMASWGYSNRQQREEAREKGISILDSIEGLPGILKG